MSQMDEDNLVEELEHMGAVELADCDDKGEVVGRTERVDNMIASMFPAAAAEIEEAEQVVAAGGIRGQITAISEDRPAALRQRAVDEILANIHRERRRVPEELQTEEEFARQREWKDPTNYHEPNHPWSKFVEFKIHEYGSIDWAWLDAVAGRADVPLNDRLSHIVCYLNNFWATIGTGRNMCILNKARSTTRNAGTPIVAETKASEFENFMCHRSITFATSEHYSIIEKQEIMRLFNGGASRGPVSSTALPECRKSVKFNAMTGEPERTGSKTYCVNAFKLWKFHRLRRSVTTVIFDPTPEAEWEEGRRLTHRHVINRWHDFAFNRKRVENAANVYEDRLRIIEDHVRQFVCNGDDDQYDQFIYTLAFWLQRPHAKFESVPILRGEQGVGKSVILDMFLRIVGEDMCYKTTDMDDAVGDKTDNLEGIYILYLNEAYNPNRKGHDSKLKAIVTEGTYRLRKFYCPPIQVPKFFRVVMDTNFADVINAEGRDRRYQLYQCSDEVPSRGYFHRLFRAIYGVKGHYDDGGLMAFADMLYNLDLDAMDERFESGRDPIITPLLVQQQMASMDARKRVFLEILQQGSIHETSRCFDREDEWLKNQRVLTGVGFAELNRNRCQQELQLLVAAKKQDTPEFEHLKEEKEYWTEECRVSRNWETVVPIDKLVRVYRKMAQEQGNRKAMELGLVNQAKAIFGHANVFYYERSVELIATEKDLKAGVPTKPRGPGEENRKFELLLEPVKRNYLQLPLLLKARTMFAKSMGWDKASFDPFEKDSADAAKIQATHNYNDLFEAPAAVRSSSTAAVQKYNFKRMYSHLTAEPQPLDTQADAALYDDEDSQEEPDDEDLQDNRPSKRARFEQEDLDDSQDLTQLDEFTLHPQ